MARSWFYLTLWHGTPPEMTEFVSAEIGEAERPPGTVVLDKESMSIDVESIALAQEVVCDTSSARAEIAMKTEVAWYVGRIQP